MWACVGMRGHAWACSLSLMKGMGALCETDLRLLARQFRCSSTALRRMRRRVGRCAPGHCRDLRLFQQAKRDNGAVVWTGV